MFEENSRRTRVADQIQKTIAGILHEKISDPRLEMTTVSAITVSKDLAYAKVYVTFLNENDKQSKLKTLNKASGYIRKLLAERMNLRVTPELKFFYDDALKQGLHVAKLIEQVSAELNDENEGKLSHDK